MEDFQEWSLSILIIMLILFIDFGSSEVATHNPVTIGTPDYVLNHAAVGTWVISLPNSTVNGSDKTVIAYVINTTATTEHLK